MPSPRCETAAAVNQSWWARGLALLERLPAGGQADAMSAEHAKRRLDRWRDAHGATGTDQFARRLAEVGLTEPELIDLLAEQRESLAVRTARPTWAAFIERALAGSPSDVPEPANSASWADRFAFAMHPLVTAATNKLIRRTSRLAGAARLDLDALADDFADQLGRRLTKPAARTLVLELNVARVHGLLAGSTAAQRFADFTSRLATGDGLVPLFEEYPVLARVLGQACQYAVQAQIELLNRFAGDRTEIVDTLLGGVDPGALQQIEVGQGDLHQRGRAVAILHFSGDKTVVYKPRSQALQVHFGELVGWLNDNVPGLELRAATTLPRTGYGWLELVAHRPCADVAEVDRFYRRQGALLALLYAVDATDMHFENLIAAGDQPVLIDVETLFHPTLPPTMTAGPDPAGQALATSVSRTALLPFLLLGEHGVLDMSGLGGDRGATLPFDAVDWEATGTDEMRLVRRAVEFRGAVNRPRLGDRDVDPGDYQAALLTGFRAAYDAIVAHRSELVDPGGLLERYAEDEIRIVVRPTQLYAMLLDESTHPDVLRDGLDRDPVFDALWTDSLGDDVKRRLLRHEVTDLWAGDVPIFLGRPASRDVWTTTGECLVGLLNESSLASVIAKLAGMGEVDRHDQEWLISATMATRAGAVHHRSGAVLPGSVVEAVPDAHRLLAAACGIADQIVASAVHDENRANWIGLELVDNRHWAVLPMGAALADGYTGVALFLAQLGALTGAERYTDLARKALHPIPRLIDTLTTDADLAQAVGVGGFLGLGGMCYALARMSTLLGGGELAQWLAAAVALASTVDEPDLDQETGIAAGRAGGLAAMLAVHAETGLDAAAQLASVLADSLGEPDRPTGPMPRNGFLFGPAGSGWALLRFAATGTAQRHANAAQAGNTALNRDSGLETWLGGGDIDYGWCSGVSGAMLARAGVADRESLNRCTTMLVDRTPLRDTSLCHGELGVIEALTVLSARGSDAAATARVHGAARLLGALNRDGPRCGTPGGAPSPGLLTGLAGVGYGLLRLGFADRVPSVLILEPNVRRGRNEPM